jgi:hypothetical protein
MEKVKGSEYFPNALYMKILTCTQIFRNGSFNFKLALHYEKGCRTPAIGYMKPPLWKVLWQCRCLCSCASHQHCLVHFNIIFLFVCCIIQQERETFYEYWSIVSTRWLWEHCINEQGGCENFEIYCINKAMPRILNVGGSPRPDCLASDIVAYAVVALSGDYIHIPHYS